MANTAVAIRPPARLRKPAYVNVDDDMWEIATESLWPTANDPKVVAQALTYCRIRGLDPYRKPVHIVARWNASLGREIEQLTPGQNELLVTAERTGEFVGVDKPVFGKMITQTFRGRKKTRDGWVDHQVTLTFPETIEVTVYRWKHGQARAFVSPIRWLEEYQRVGGGELPNEMWCRRTYDQAQKVALAASLRIAFADVVPPEDDDVSLVREPVDMTIENEPLSRPPPPSLPKDEAPKGEASKPDASQPEVPHDPVTGEVGPHSIEFIDQDDKPENWQHWGARVISAVQSSTTEEELESWIELNAQKLTDFSKDNPTMYAKLDAQFNKHRNKIKLTKKGDGNGGTASAKTE